MEHDHYPEQEEQQRQYQNASPPPHENPENEPCRPGHSYGMAAAALILGIISLVTVCCFYISIPLGALAILLAILSKGSQETFSNQAKSGLILAIIGIIAALVLTIGAVTMQFSYMRNGEFRKQLEEYLESYGLDDYGSDDEDSYFDYAPYQEVPSSVYPGDTI